MMNIDRIAGRLARWGARARALPAALYTRGGFTYPLMTSRGDRIGHAIPGRGLLLEADFKRVGITRAIPNVLERTPWMRAAELVARALDPCGAITSIADVQAAYANWRQQSSATETFQPVGGTTWVEQFDVANNANFGAALTPTRATAGAYSARLSNPPAGQKKYLVGLSTIGAGTGQGYGMGILCDALSAIGNIDATSIVLQTLTMNALTRNTDGKGVYIGLFVATGSGLALASPSTYTLSYTNQANVAARTATTTSSGGSGTESVSDNTSGEVPCVPYQSSDFGCRTVASITCSVASTTAPSLLGLLLYKPVCWLHAIEETSISIEREVRQEPEMLVELVTDGSGVLGFLTILWQAPTASGNAQTMTHILDTIVG